jgi:hypothetical protein
MARGGAQEPKIQAGSLCYAWREALQGRMAFAPEGQHDSSQVRSAWSHEENSPVPPPVLVFWQSAVFR